MTTSKKYKCRQCGEVVTQHKLGEKPVRSGMRDFAGDTRGCTMSECHEDNCPHPVANADERFEAGKIGAEKS